jgi:hypothetical protein
VPIRDDLAADLRAWLAEKLALLQANARRADEPIPSRLPAETRLFVVPTGTDTYGRCAVARLVALTDDKPVRTVAIGDKMGTIGMASDSAGSIAGITENTMKKRHIYHPGKRAFKSGRGDSNS